MAQDFIKVIKDAKWLTSTQELCHLLHSADSAPGSDLEATSECACFPCSKAFAIIALTAALFIISTFDFTMIKMRKLEHVTNFCWNKLI